MNFETLLGVDAGRQEPTSNMNEVKIKKELRHLIRTVIEEQEVLPIEFMVDGFPNASCAYLHFLAHYHVRRVAEILASAQFGLSFDLDLEQEIRMCIDKGVKAQPDVPIKIDCLVTSIITAHSVRCPDFDEPLVDPDWLVSTAVGGIRMLIQDVLNENVRPGRLQAAYVVTRDGEDFLVPCALLTTTELEAIADANRVMERL